MTRTVFNNGESGLSIRTELNRNLGEVINVKSYGATGNGVTNDSVTVQAAITAALTLGVKEVVFPPGTYSLKNVRLWSNITYTLMSGATILTFPDSPLGGNTLNANGEENIIIRGGVIDGNKGIVAGSPDSGTTLLQLIGSSNIRVKGVIFQNNEYLAVIPSQATNVRVEGCGFYNVDCAFQPAQDCHDIWAVNNLIDGGSSDGIVIWATSTSAQSTNVHIIGNTIKNKPIGLGIIVRRCDNFEVTGNIIHDCALAIAINHGEASGGFSHHGVIKDNVIYNNPSTYAIGGESALFMSISGNVIHDCDNDGISFDGLFYSDIKDNIITDINDALTDSVGIRISSSNRVTIGGNKVVDNRTVTKNYMGIRVVSGDKNVLENNTVRNVTLVDIYINAGVTATTAKLNDARVDDHATAGETAFVNNQKGADANIVVASGATSILLRDAPGDMFNVSATGARAVSTINGGIIGRKITLCFSDGNITLSGGNLRLAGGTLTSVANGTVELVYDGTNWRERCRSLTNS